MMYHLTFDKNSIRICSFIFDSSRNENLYQFIKRIIYYPVLMKSIISIQCNYNNFFWWDLKGKYSFEFETLLSELFLNLNLCKDDDQIYKVYKHT